MEERPNLGKVREKKTKYEESLMKMSEKSRNKIKNWNACNHSLFFFSLLTQTLNIAKLLLSGKV